MNLPETPGNPEKQPTSLGELLDIIAGGILSRPTASYDAVYERLEAGKPLNEILDWHCRENLQPAMPLGLETAKASLAAVLRFDHNKMVPCPCGKCDKSAPAMHTADTMVLQPFVRFIVAHN